MSHILSFEFGIPMLRRELKNAEFVSFAKAMKEEYQTVGKHPLYAMHGYVP